MGLLLAFAPFIVFAVLNHFATPSQALLAAAVVSLALLVRDAVTPGRAPKLLEIGTCVMFSVLAAYAYWANPDWPVVGVKLAVDIGLLAIVLLTIVLGQPFTLQYAREQVAPEHWGSENFKKTNMTITLVWAAAFAVLIAADLVLLLMPQVPHKIGVLLTVLALYGAFKFTMVYPKRA